MKLVNGLGKALRKDLRLVGESKSSAQQQASNRPQDLVLAMRPQQWLKSGFVFLGIIFSGHWQQWNTLWRVALAALAFSLVASGVYVLNDLFDQEDDRRHPVKRQRPIAAGLVSPAAARILLLISITGGLGLAWTVSTANVLILLVYLVQNIAYSKRLKRIVLLDVFVIAFGFMLRILSGTFGVGITPSNWLLLCGLMITLFIGFGKRWAELAEGNGVGFRAVLNSYNSQMLNQFTGICAGGAILTYGLYTLDPGTVALHQTEDLIYTIPFVIYGVFRYLYLIYSGEGGDPSKLVVRDRHIAITVVLWLTSVVLIMK